MMKHLIASLALGAVLAMVAILPLAASSQLVFAAACPQNSCTGGDGGGSGGSGGSSDGSGTATGGSAKSEVCSGIGLTGGNCGDSGTKISDVLNNIVNLLAIIVGTVAVIMIVVSGLRFITASGDASKISAARNTLIYAIVGLVVVILAREIVDLVINRVK